MKMLYIENVATVNATNFYEASVRAAHDLGIEFHLAYNCLDRKENQIERLEKELGLTFHQIDFVRNPLHPHNLRAYRQTVALMKQEGFDIVHCNTPIGGVVGRLAAKKCGIDKVIYQAHGFHFYKGAPLLNWLLYYPVERWLAHITDTLITINTEDYRRAKRFRLRKGGKVYYVPGVGIDTSAYRGESGKAEAIRSSLGILPDDMILISVGRLDKNKNNETLIKAVSKLKDSVHLLICGEGEERDKLIALSKALNCMDRIHFLGNITYMKELYKATDVFIMASLREGLSRSLMEAMASGLPCVVSSIRGNVDLIQPGVNGYLCNPRDPDDYVTSISRMLSQTERRASVGRQNREDVQRYDIESIETMIKDIYQRVLVV